MTQEKIQVANYLLADDGTIPNNDHFPLLVYPNVIDGSPTTSDPASQFEQLFQKNAWGNSWRNGVLPYHHYHSQAHEVLGCYSGSATIQFGGDSGITQDIQAGDAVVIPAGVGHKRVSSSPDFRVVGAYPPKQPLTTNLAKPEEHNHAKKQIESVALPPKDPIYGESGPLKELWPVKSEI